ncbi:MAG TPA: ABC transporter substrate-binding protein [Stellaceae bacterium]|nr:ABC transporter substrate-binding protein [Stellaceae bacterium]
MKHSKNFGLGQAWCGLLLAAAALLLPSGANADPLKLRVAWVAVPGQLTPILYENKSILKHYGTSYTVEPVRVPGSGPQLTALASGDLEIAQFAPAAFALAVQNAHMENLRVVGDTVRDGFEDYHSRKFVVLADGPIKSVEDLKGKVIGSNSIGGAMDMGMRSYLRAHGLEDKRDFSVVEIDFANQWPALTSAKSDLAFMTIPFSIPVLKTGKANVLFTMKDAMHGASELTIMCILAPFIEQHRAALVDYFEDSQRAMHWFLDPKNRTEVLEIVARFTKSPAADYSDWLFTKGDDYHDPDSRLNVTVMQHDIQVLHDLGMLKIDLDVKKYADTSLVDEAAKRLN